MGGKAFCGAEALGRQRLSDLHDKRRISVAVPLPVWPYFLGRHPLGEVASAPELHHHCTCGEPPPKRPHRASMVSGASISGASMVETTHTHEKKHSTNREPCTVAGRARNLEFMIVNGHTTSYHIDAWCASSLSWAGIRWARHPRSCPQADCH